MGWGIGGWEGGVGGTSHRNNSFVADGWGRAGGVVGRAACGS